MAAKKRAADSTGMAPGDPRWPLKVARLREARAKASSLEGRVPEIDDPEYEEWETAVRMLLTELFGASGYLIRFRQLTIHPVSHFAGGNRQWHSDPHTSWQTGLKQAAAILAEAIEEAEMHIAPAPSARLERASSLAPRTNKVFVVHGHDEAARESVARFLEKLGIEVVILHEQATGGRTLIEKLEHYSNVDFAVVLLTPDDLGTSCKSDVPLPRARQNVVLELGYFFGKLGRGHVCALYKGPLELPSDVIGIGYVPLDERGDWRVSLAKELRVAGFSIDMNQVV
jgi:predicted nucleotide-binding protein